MLSREQVREQSSRVFDAYHAQIERLGLTTWMARRLLGVAAVTYNNWLMGASPNGAHHVAMMKDLTARFRRLDRDRLPLHFLGRRGYFKLREYLEAEGKK